MTMNQKQFYNTLSILVLTMLAVIYWYLFDFLRWDMFDSPSFIAAARELFGLEGGYNYQSRLSKPLVLIIPGALESMISIDAQWGFIFQTIIAYFGCGLFIKRIVYKLTKRFDLAFYALMIYVLSQVFAIFSLMVLVDAVGWFFSLLIIDIAITKVEHEKISIWVWMFLAAMSAIGLLIKESVIFSFIFVIFYQLYYNKMLKDKLLGLVVSASVFLCTFALTQIITQVLFNDSIVVRLIAQQERVGFVYYSLENVMQLFRVFDFYWLLFVFGVFALRKSEGLTAKKHEIYALLWAFFLSLIFMPIYPFVVDRILFMIAPTLVVIAVFSEYYFKKLMLPVIIIGGILNVSISYIIYKYNYSGALLLGLLLYLIILVISLLYIRKKV